jgi:hypothetical protein
VAFIENLRSRPVYVIHGDADDNVPISEAYAMVSALDGVTSDLTFHREPGAGHWWDGEVSPGADCVDWPPLFSLMDERTLDPALGTFRFTTPAPWVNDTFAWLRVHTCARPDQPCEVASERDGAAVTVTTKNVASLSAHTAVLLQAGVRSLTVDGQAVTLSGDWERVGDGGLREGLATGPFTAALYRPFCWITPDQGGPALEYTRWLSSVWSIIGNGTSCILPYAQRERAVQAGRALIFVGLPSADLPIPASLGLAFDQDAISIGGTYPNAAIFAAFPGPNGALYGAIAATASATEQWFRLQPYTSRLILPDYLVLTAAGVVRAGHFDRDFAYDASLSAP